MIHFCIVISVISVRLFIIYSLFFSLLLSLLLLFGPSHHRKNLMIGARRLTEEDDLCVNIVDLLPIPLNTWPRQDRTTSERRCGERSLMASLVQKTRQSLKTYWPKSCNIFQHQQTRSNRTHEGKLKPVCARNGMNRKQRNWNFAFESVLARRKRDIFYFFQQKNKSKHTSP